ncbi:hypothetical protein M758_1G330100 [Ceratodon purpureus]|uniref:Uncharacterized protein n=1 Tax=Ceratodon purpureus TaxID=3225 RepID=A0A8T0JCA8_CERPU|nr:hypothetical protein KC19_1G337600 [Ceratodon purpureus]KAG0632462.1 hypothetical protein M758_1G330100 [Ceratodon purpureus]
MASALLLQPHAVAVLGAGVGCSYQDSWVLTRRGGSRV